MALQNKYQSLIDAAQTAGATNLQVRQQGTVLYIDGEVASESVKKSLWDKYNQLDPDYRSGDLVLNLNVAAGGSYESQFDEYEVASGDSLSKIAQKYGVHWKKIHEANSDLIKNPDLIQPGWKLKIPKS